MVTGCSPTGFYRLSETEIETSAAKIGVSVKIYKRLCNILAGIYDDGLTGKENKRFNMDLKIKQITEEFK